MQKELTYTIQGWDTQNDSIESIHDELKEYAKEELGWREQISNPDYDPEDEESEATVDNPITYEQAIFYQQPMSLFWRWLKNHKKECAYATVDQTVETDIEALKAQVELTVE